MLACAELPFRALSLNSSTPAVYAHELGKRFGGKPAVSHVSFEVQPGEVFGLLGPNGAGKTTTLRMLAGLYRPDVGEATVAGISAAGDPDRLRERVGLLTEQPGLYDRLTARENLAFFARLYGVARSEVDGRIDRWLDRLGLLEKRDERAGTLSKGQRQKLAIARAFLHEPPVVLLDEPTSGLDPESANVVRETIAALSGEGRTLILCSHNLFEVERLCRRVGVLRAFPGEGGRLLVVTEVSHLRGRARMTTIRLTTSAEPFVDALRGIPGIVAAKSEGHELRLELSDGELATPRAIAQLVQAGAAILEVALGERHLEDAYLALVADSDMEAGAA
jgi:ABC-2 type transport system ATP-binding protein